MLNDLLFPLTLAAALGSGLIAGVFFGFSSFVMKALGKIPVEQGIAAMQSINIVVINPLFLGVFIGTALVCLPLGLAAVTRWSAPSGWLIAGALLYVIGCFGVTIRGNVPLNDALAAVDPTSATGAALWRDYLVQWTMWNHVRTVTSLAAAAAFIVAMRKAAVDFAG